ncbi:hypothetical protein EQH57_0138 [Dictyocoela roeselum]|nr:hypothetical protein EQH57_0138 [Dictyocoela roeselum]
MKSLKRKVNGITTHSLKCQLNKNFAQKYGETEGYLYAEEFNQKISSDIIGPLKTKHYEFKNKYEYFYIITFTDIFSGITELEIIFSITSQTIIKSFNKRWIEK